MNATPLMTLRRACSAIVFGAMFFTLFPQQSLAVADNTAPVVSTVTPTTAVNGVASTFSATYTDAVGVTSCLLYKGNASLGSMTLAGTTSGTASLSYTPTSTSSFTMKAKCYDAAGNNTTGTAVTVTVSSATDTTAPVVGTLSPTTATAGTAVTFSVSYSDAVGVTSCNLAVDGEIQTGSMTLGASATSGTATKSYTPSAAGTSTVLVACEDAAGNAGQSTATSVVIAAAAADTTAPTVGTVSPTTATAGTAVTLSVSAADDGGIASCTLHVDGANQGAMSLDSGSPTFSRSHTFSAAGSYSVYASCTDDAGNPGAGTVVEVVVAAAASSDTTSPTVGTLSPLTATAGTAVTLTATVSDNVAVTGCTLYVGNVSKGAMTIAGGSASKAYTFSAAGSFVAKATCVDAAGNSASGTSVTVVVSAAAAADTTAPTVGTVSPLVATAGVATTFSATYSDAVGVTSCTAYLDVDMNAMALSSGTASVSYTFDTAGAYPAYVSCEDAAGNETTSGTVTVVVSAASTDTTAPTISTITPTTATQNTAVTLSATVTDASGIQSCHLHVNGSDQGAMTASGSTYSRSYTPAGSGTFTAYAGCSDVAGNAAAGIAATVTVTAATSSSTDTTAPTVGAIVATNAVAGIAIPLSASVADSGGMGTCVVYINGTNVGSMTISGGSATYLYTFSAEGSATANAYCVDAAGNATRGASSLITIAGNTTAEEDDAVSEAATNTLIKMACGAIAEVSDPCHAVYYYDGYRHAFPNEKVFFTWYEDFDDVIIVTDDFMASVTLGFNVTYHPGTRMVKFITVRTVYAVGSNGELRAIASEDVAASIWGSDWNTQIDDISDAFFGNYTFGEAIDSTSDFDPDAVEAATTNIAEMFPS